MASLERSQRLTGKRPRRQQQPVRLDGTLVLRPERQRLGGGEGSLPHGATACLQPQFRGTLAIAGPQGETGRELAGLALEVRVERFYRRRQARADGLPFLGEQRRPHGVHRQCVTEPESAGFGVDELNPRRLAESIDGVFRRAAQRRRHHVPVELPPEHRRVPQNLHGGSRQ